MKTIKILSLLLLTTFMFASCSKDEDDDNTASVAGTSWQTTYYKYTVAGETVDLYDTKAELIDAYLYISFTLNADGTIIIDSEDAGTWQQAGSTVTLNMVDEDITCKIDGNTLVNSESGSAYGFTFASTTKFTKM